LLKDLITVCQETDVSEDLQLLLINGISDYLQDCHLEFPQQYPDALQDLINEQYLIGWDQFMMGRPSKLWCSIHQEQLQRRGIAHTPFNSGPGWMTQLIRVIWKHVHAVWIARNLARHGRDLADQHLKQRQKCIDEIHCYYQYRSNNQLILSPDQETMFYSSFQHHLRFESELHQLQTWLCTYREVIESCKTDQSTVTTLLSDDASVETPSDSPTSSPTDPAMVPQHHSQSIKNDTIQFDGLPCAICIPQSPTSDICSTTACSQPTPPSESASLVNPRVVNSTHLHWKCPTDDYIDII